MTAVVETERRIVSVGDLKFIMIQTSSACNTGHTIDFGTDTADAKETVISEIYNVLIQDDAGQDEETTWDPATGILTMGTLTGAGIHNIFIVAR